ncbi:MAG: zinc-ribbon domain-containing protein [Gudongella sp.]|nr:zinc-ribbon domain-containing protein [Gudongella sp.]
MVLLFGTSSKEQKLDFIQSIVCSNCGEHGEYEAFMTYSIFTIFFIPIFKWNKKFYIISKCCWSTYRLNKELGRAIERGDNISINDSDLEPININNIITCSNCGFVIEDGFEYCPKCGEKLN